MTRRWLDVVLCGYNVIHIFQSLFFNAQGFAPEWLFPAPMKKLMTLYLSHYRDPFMADMTYFPWFQAFVFLEYTLILPYFFVAAYAYYKGAASCPWIRLPSLMYGVEAFSAILALTFVVCLDDFSRYPVPGPRNFRERMDVCGAYAIFLVYSLVLIVDTLFSSAYRTRPKTE